MSEPPARRRRWPWVVLALAALLVFAVWWWRDLPRRQVERILERELVADVSVGGLSIEGSRRFSLHDLRVRRMGGQPYLEVATVDRITVQGSLPRVRVADFETMDVTGVHILLRPPTGEPLPPPSSEPSTLKVGRLTLRNGEVVVRAGDGEARLPFAAAVEGIGSDLVGEVRARASTLPLGPVLALLGFPGSQAALRGLAASVRLEHGGGGALEASSTGLVLPTGVFPGAHVTGSATPSPDGRTLAVDARADLSLARELRGRATLEAASLAPLTAEVHGKGVALGELTLLVPMLPQGASLDGTADVDVVLQDEETVAVAARASLSRARLEQPWLTLNLDGADAEARATLTRDTGPLRGPAHARLRLPRLQARGASWAVPSTVAPAVLDVQADVASLTPPDARGKLSLVTRGMGTLAAEGHVAQTPLAGDLTWQWSGLTMEALRASLAELGLALPEPLSLQGRARLTGTLRGELGRPALAGALVADGLETRWGERALSGGTLQARFRVPPGLTAVEVPSLALTASAVVPPLAPLPVQLEAGARWDTTAERLTVPRASVRASAGLGTVAFDGSWQRGGGAGRVHLQGAELPAWLPVLRPLLGDPVAGYTVRGTASADATVRLAGDGTFSGDGKAAITRSGFASEDGSRVLEGFESSWTLHGEGGARGWRAHAETKVGGFQLLWGAVFGDYSTVTSHLTVDARGGTAEGPPWTLEGTLAMPDGPLLAGSLQPGLRWSGSMEVPDLGRTVERYLRAPLGESLPLFERIEARGRARVQASGVASSSSHTASGGVTLEDVDLAGTAGYVTMSGLGAVLPFDLRWERVEGGAWSLTGPPMQGTLEFDGMEVAGLTLAALKSGVVLLGDDLTFEEKLTVPILGGEVRFEALRLQDLFLPTRHLLSGVLITGIALPEVAAAFGLPPLEGSVEALFPEVRLDAHTLQVEGGGEVGLFGGTVRLAGISGEDVLTRFPKLHLSATFEGIDLGRVTRVFDFGEISGVVAGHVRDLRLFRGVPVSFEAAIQSVPTEGVRQFVNVKAVRNLTILGTGARISPLDRGIQRFFDKYTYAAIGIYMKLENDVFVLRGTAGSKEGRELFVRGRLPFPINIVNAQPGKTVSFSSMVERLHSVDFSAASSTPTSAP
ncbi:MAG TPA: hypothetical protein VFV75_05860 [Candidatus Polarisedimenticolaceae bacterium]|nr:hypothetical protein [Candidatus Polarisedimenticolaceae bacterium]